MGKTINITEEELKRLENVRDYFGQVSNIILDPKPYELIHNLIERAVDMGKESVGFISRSKQEEAILLITNSVTDGGDYSEYIKKAKDFLQSLKPRIYVCKLGDKSLMYLLKNEHTFVFVEKQYKATMFDSTEDALKYILGLKESRICLPEMFVVIR